MSTELHDMIMQTVDEYCDGCKGQQFIRHWEGECYKLCDGFQAYLAEFIAKDKAEKHIGPSRMLPHTRKDKARIENRLLRGRLTNKSQINKKG